MSLMILGGKVKEDKGISNEGPFESIKGFLKVHFENDASMFTLHLLGVGDIFLYYDGIIISFGEKATLALTNDTRKERLYVINNDLGYKLVGGITKADRSEVL